MQKQVMKYQVLMALFVGSYASIPLQGSLGSPCVTTTTVTRNNRVTDTRIKEPCMHASCPVEFNCPQAGCRTATLTHTVQLPSTWVKPVSMSPLPFCFGIVFRCAAPSTQAFTCENQDDCRHIVTTTVVSTTNEPNTRQTPLPCFKPECPRIFVCPDGDCQTATLTKTLVVPPTGVQLGFSSASSCHNLACLVLETETVSCPGYTLTFPG
ncbi:unnamed protein product [Meganyctiphanes norvegica]|uniref:Uncharacterized protein n=1 Tax=Meganyctiphanes norvegica TaxID=48144 RepID=A0AAV2Q540_MEGNR